MFLCEKARYMGSEKGGKTDEKHCWIWVIYGVIGWMGVGDLAGWIR